MAVKPKRPCNYPGCGALVDYGYCDKHKKKKDLRRGSAASRGYDRDWQRYRERYLKEHPLCVICEKEGKVTPSTVIDHIKDHKGNKELFWNPGNHQPLCKMHHDRKTAITNQFGR